jgi:hypothetical protein
MPTFNANVPKILIAAAKLVHGEKDAHANSVFGGYSCLAVADGVEDFDGKDRRQARTFYRTFMPRDCSNQYEWANRFGSVSLRECQAHRVLMLLLAAAVYESENK